MRIFYIFKINKEFANLTKKHPYNLYKTIEQIYYLNPHDLNLAYKMFETIADAFNKRKINLDLFEIYRHNDHYTKFNNVHMINNYYTDEQSELTIKNSHLILKSTSNNPTFLKNLRTFENIFVCDFQNKDYFWLDQIHANV